MENHKFRLLNNKINCICFQPITIFCNSIFLLFSLKTFSLLQIKAVSSV